MNISCLEELQMKLDLCISRDERLGILKTVGKIIKSNKWFVITDDGQCHLFDRDGNLDDISIVNAIYKSYIRKDIKRICIPDSVTSIGDSAFSSCSSLTSVKIPNNVTSIGDYMFTDCASLISVMIPNTVTHIGNYAFYGCCGFTSIKILNSVTSIENHAFAWCNSLTNMMIPHSVISIGNKAFIGCTSLTSITFKGKTLGQVKAMDNYPWRIEDKSIIHIE